MSIIYEFIFFLYSIQISLVFVSYGPVKYS